MGWNRWIDGFVCLLCLYGRKSGHDYYIGNRRIIEMGWDEMSVQTVVEYYSITQIRETQIAGTGTGPRIL